VTGEFDVDSEIITFKKVYREKWTTKRGSEYEELTGHETTYFVNDVPLSAGDYKTKVSEIIDESVAKIITNPTYFNEKIKWQDRRIMLSTMAGEVSNDEIIKSVDGDLSELKELISSGAKLNEEKAKISVQKKRIKTELEQIPSRLDEVSRSKPEQSNWQEIENQIGLIDNEIKLKNLKIDNVNESIQSQKNEILKIQTEKFQKEQRLNELSREQLSTSSENIPSTKTYLPFCHSIISSASILTRGTLLPMCLLPLLKSREPPTVGLNPSGMDVKLLKSREPPTVGLNPSGMDVKPLK